VVVVSREFQSTCLAFRSPAIKSGNPPPKHADKSDPIMVREGEMYTAKILRGPLANIICTAVASNWVKTGTGTA
jgi:hypothetical protein